MPTTKLSKGDTALKRRVIVCSECGVLLFTTIKSSCFVLVSPPSRLNTHTLIPALKCIKIISVIFSQCLPAYIYFYITTLLNQFKVGRSHDYIEVGRRGGQKEAKGGEEKKKNQCHSVIAYYSVILCIDIDNTYVYICRD